MGKRIWLVNQYAMPPHLESRLRTIKFAHYLALSGYDVTIFASSVMHNMNIDLIEDNAPFVERQYDDLHFVHIKTKKYSHNDINRFIGLVEFPIKFLHIAKNFDEPDVIVQTATVPFGNIIAKYAQKVQARYIVEVLDLWPETFVELGLIGKKNPALPFLYYTEKKAYQRADVIVFSMEGGKNYIIDKKWNMEQGGPLDLQKVHYINNGVDLTDFDRYKADYQIEDAVLTDDALKKVIYVGSMRLANNLRKLIDAAALLQEYKDIKFLLYGDGDDRKVLENYCKENNISNVIFKEKWIDPKYVPYVLSQATLNVLNYMPGHFAEYGGSQSKMFQYMASGKPICCNLKMMYCPINKNNIGIARVYNDAQDYANAILSIIQMSGEEYVAMCMRARKTANEFDYQYLTDKLMALF